MSVPEDGVDIFHKNVILDINNDLNNNKKIICHCRGGIGYYSFFLKKNY